MTDTDIEKLLQQIETEMQDDLESVLYLPANEFSTETLQRLWLEWEKRYYTFQRQMKWCNRVGGSTLVFFMASVVLFIIGYVALSRVFLVLFGIALISTIIGYALLMKQYGVGIKQDYIGKAIYNELTKRQKE